MIRIAAALLLVILNLSGAVRLPESILSWVLVAIFTLTAIAGNCPVYTIFGINTHTRKKEFKQYH